MSKNDEKCFWMHCENPVSEQDKIHFVFIPCLEHTSEAIKEFEELIKKEGSDITKWQKPKQ